MVSLQPVPVDDPRSRALLTEYFQMRGAAFPKGQTYRPVFPDASVFTPPAGIFLIAVDEGADVGCGGIRRLPDGPDGVRYEVKHLYLRPETRGRGWGRRVLEALETRAHEWDAVDIVLDTHHTLESAGALYTRSGYTTIEPYNDNPNATVWLRKKLVSAENG